jgi:hypothetical protein
LQGILGLLSAVLGKQFFLDCYNPVGEIMDMMTLTNSSVNFILYCLMSSQFRITLRKIFLPRANQTRPSSRNCILSSSKVEVGKAQSNELFWIPSY